MYYSIGVYILSFISRTLIIIGLCLSSANSPTIEALQDKITQSVRDQFVVADEEAISRPVSSAKPRPKTFYPSLLPFVSVVVLTTVADSTYSFESNLNAIQPVFYYARGPPIS